MKIVYKKNDKIIAQNAQWARDFFSRMKGLLGRKTFSGNDNIDALLISPCKQVHSIGMNFPFDAIYLDNTMRVIEIFENVRPCRILPFNAAAKSILEMPAGSCKNQGLEVGDVLKYCE